MRLSELFTRTLREAPAEAEMASHRLALRAGLVRPVAAGIYALMPLGWRVMRKIEAILREEMEAAGAQEMRMPVVHPAELWQATGRWDSFGPVLLKFATEGGRDCVLGPTHEEVISALAAREVDSYKQLPQRVFQIQTKYRHEPRPRGGLIRLREFTMKDAYSLDVDAAGMDASYEAMVRAYRAIFARVGVPAIAVEADTGAMGGSGSQEFVVPHDGGEDRFVQCDRCGYAANVEAAQFALAAPDSVEWEPVRQVATPGCKTIQEVADFLGVPTTQTLKAVFFVQEMAGAPDRFVFALVRGDLEINEVKLINALGGGTLRAATDDEIRGVGAVPGYASPIGVSREATVIADRSVLVGANFVAGANVEGYHLMGVNVTRDVPGIALADLAEARDGLTCARCGQGRLVIRRAIELGHCFKLGTRYSEPVNVSFQDEQGAAHPVMMGSYGIGLERLMAVIIEAHHDEWGIVWPASVAPFGVHIVTLGKGDHYAEVGAQLAAELAGAGIEALLDDRNETPGVKFADADLIGCPVRLTVSQKALDAGGIEAKRRAAQERVLVPRGEVIDWVRAALAES